MDRESIIRKAQEEFAERLNSELDRIELMKQEAEPKDFSRLEIIVVGVKCVIAKSIARIHKGNLVNHGIIPMLFEDPAAYDSIDQGDELRIENLLDQIPTRRVTVKDVTKHFAFTVKLDLTDNEIEVVLAGGQLRNLRRQLENM